MQGEEPLRIRFLVESVDFHDIPIVVFHLGVAEGDLVLERLRSKELHRFQMRMELVQHSQRDLQHVFDYKTHCYVIGESNLVADAHELSISGNGQHLLGQGSTQTKSSSSGGEPEGHFFVRPLPGCRLRGHRLPLLKRVIRENLRDLVKSTGRANIQMIPITHLHIR